MLRKIAFIAIMFLFLLLPVNALCGDDICEKNENSESCCMDCGCVSGETCQENKCVKSVTMFSFTSEVSIFLLILIILFAAFVIGYGLNIVIAAHKKTEEHLENERRQKEEPEPVVLLTEEGIKAQIVGLIKEGKTINDIKKELRCKNVDPKVADDLLMEVIDSLVAKAEQGLLSVDWDPRIVDYVFKEIMRKPEIHHRRKGLHYHKKQKHIEEPKKIIEVKKIKPAKPTKEELVRDVEKFIGIGLARGYSKEEIKVIFEEFRQLNGSKSKTRSGSGLGLAISKKPAT